MSTENDLLFKHSGEPKQDEEAGHAAAAAEEGVVEAEEFEKYLDDNRREFLESSGLIDDGIAEEGDLMRVLDCGELFKPFAAELVGKEESSGSNGSPSRGGGNNKFATTTSESSILEEQNSHSPALHVESMPPDFALEGSNNRIIVSLGETSDHPKKLDLPPKMADSCMPMHQVAVLGGSSRGKWLLEDLAGVAVMQQQQHLEQQQHQGVTFSDSFLFSEGTTCTTVTTTTGESSSTSLPTSVVVEEAQAAAASSGGEFGSSSSKDTMLEGIFPMRGGIMPIGQIPEDGEAPRFVRGMDLAGDSLHPFHTPPPPTMHHHGFCHPSMHRSLSIGHLPMSSALPPFQFSSSISSMDQHHQHHAMPAGSHLSPAFMESLHGLGSSSSIIRRVFSTGDIPPSTSAAATTAAAAAAAAAVASPSQDDPANKVGRYSAEERKVRIDRYRQKRTERNFIKKIKYACRKTLADSRPRIRGRFAKNQDAGLPQAKRKLEDDDDEDCDLLLDDDEDYVVDKDAGSNKIMEEIRTEDRDLFEVAFNNNFM